jgi:hypothetical protein
VLNKLKKKVYHVGFTILIYCDARSTKHLSLKMEVADCSNLRYLSIKLERRVSQDLVKYDVTPSAPFLFPRIESNFCCCNVVLLCQLLNVRIYCQCEQN